MEHRARTPLIGMAALLLSVACDDAAAGRPSDAAPEPEVDAADAGDAGTARPSTCRDRLAPRETLTIAPDMICDAHSDCRDNEDELDCPGVFICPGLGTFSDSWAIAEARLCDGAADCYTADDEMDCPELELTFCSSNDDGGKTVYSAEQRCDGHAECFDGDDERDCPDSFLCSSPDGPGIAAVIPMAKVCDGTWDCWRDEFQCPGVETFDCGGGITIPLASRCDRIDHCGVDEDPEMCGWFDCQTWSQSSVKPDACFACREDVPASSCRNGCELRYLPLEKRCDGVVDCYRGRDEEDC